MEIPTLINAKSTVKGELTFNTDSRIDGKIFGKVEADQTILIGKEGYFKGFLRARNLIVFGSIEGNFLVSGETIFHPGSSITGTLYTKEFGIKEGAIINARIETIDKSKTFEEVALNIEEEITRSKTKHESCGRIETIFVIEKRENSIVEIQNDKGSIKPEIVQSQVADKNKEEFVYSHESILNPDEFPEEKFCAVDNNSLSLIDKEALPQENAGEEISVTEPRFSVHQDNSQKTNDKPITKSALFSSLMEYPAKGGSSLSNDGLEDEKNPTEIPSSQAENNNKENIIGFNELRDILIHPKFIRVKPGKSS